MSNVYEFESRMKVVESRLESKGGGGDNGGMEARIAKLESAVDYIKSDITDIKADLRDIKKDAREDFRVLAGLVILAALGLAGLMARGFHWL